VISSVRVADPNHPGDDLVEFFALNTGTGSTAGTTTLQSLDVTMSDADGLVISATAGGRADFTGSFTDVTASWISLGVDFSAIYFSPGQTATKYTNGQSVPQFEVAGVVFGGVDASMGSGLQFAAAVVSHGSTVSIGGSLGVSNGNVVTFTYSA